MSDNKFIERLKGKDTSKSVLEIKNEATKASFANMPSGTSNAIDVYSDHRADATAVLNGTTNWKISNSNLILANDVTGDGADFSSTYSVSGAGLWIDSVYTFPSTGDPAHPIAMVFNPSTKWVLKVCGDNLIVDGGYIVDFTLLVKIGTSNVFTKTFSVAEQAGPFCKEFMLDFNETNAGIIKASGLTTLTVQLLCGTANASARIYNGMTVLTCLQRKVDASAVSNSFANVEEALQDGMLPSDYFNNAAFIDQVEDGEQAYAVFERDGDSIDLAGWTPKEEVARVEEIIIKSDTIPTASSDLVGSIYQYTGVTSAPYEHGYIYECKETSPGVYGWERIDVQPGGSRGRFLALWNCATGLAETNPPISPYEYKPGDYFVVGAVSTATPAVNYKPDGTSYIINQASTTVETNEVAVDDTYFFDGTSWKLQSNSNKTVTFSNIAGSPYDNTNLGNALDAKADETNTINGAPLSNSETFFYGTSATAGLTANKKVSIPSITTLKKGVVIFVKPDMTATTGGITLKLNDFTAYPVRYNGASISSTTDSIVWNQSYVSIFVFDGLYWQFAGHGYDKDTTYTGSDGITLTGTNFTNSGVRSVATGSTNGTISVNTNGTSADVAVYGLGSAAYTASTDYATSAQGTKADTAVQPGDLATVATTGDYDDLLNKPTIPTVNDATLTIQKNGTNVATFTANASSGVTANISVPTDTNDLTNGAGYITGITSGDVTTALGYTPYSDANPNGYTSNVGTVTSVNSVSPDGSGNVSLTIPTVNNPTITITQGGVTKGSFTLNQASGDTIALDAGGGGSVDIDNLTITKNGDDEIQAVATVNANTAVGATNPVYDWVGTLAEYTIQDVATNHPDWVCYITDDQEATAYQAYTQSQCNNLFVQKGHEVIAFQEPNAGNNYTWYRKYADGWVEQGGRVPGNTGGTYAVTMSIEMADTNYNFIGTGYKDSNDAGFVVICIDSSNMSTTGFTVYPRYAHNGSTGTPSQGGQWQVSGIAA